MNKICSLILLLVAQSALAQKPAPPPVYGSFRLVFATGLTTPVNLTVGSEDMGGYASGIATGLLDANKPDFTFRVEHDDCRRADHLLQLKDGLRFALVCYQKLPAASEETAKAKPAEKEAPRRELAFIALPADTDRSQRTISLLLVSAKDKVLTVKIGDTVVVLDSAKPTLMPAPHGGDLAVSVAGKVLAQLDTQTVQDHAVIFYQNEATGSPACITFDNSNR